MMDMRHNKHNNNSSIRYKTNKFLVVILLCKKHHPSKDVGVETDEQGMLGPETSSPSEQQEAEVEDDDAGSSDVLVVFIGMMFSAFFKLFVGLVVGLPLRHSMMVVCGRSPLFSFSLSVLLYCANGYHEKWIVAVNNDPMNPFHFQWTMHDFIAHIPIDRE
mmetsp:Transcript_2873/g.3135  ORF Transcript_2873/g.3135 Transcript_2873/m.3135 type:complete len:161 (+) Transcript_2873:299-781(+)